MVPVFGGVLAEWGQRDAVLQRQAAQGDGCEELGELGAAVFHGEPGAGGWVLLWREVGDAGGGAVGIMVLAFDGYVRAVV